MWRHLVGDFRARPDASPGRDASRPGDLHGYGLFPSRRETAGFRARRRLLEATYWLARAAAVARNRIWQANVGGAGIDHLAFHPAGLRWLAELGVDDQWRRFCERFELSRHSAAGIKACYVASLLVPHLEGRPEPRLIEIGGGVGNLVALTHFRVPLHQYAVVDLPEMLLHAAAALAACYPAVPHRYLYPGSEDVYAHDVPAFYFCVPERAGELAAGRFDAGCNVDSFQEMTEAQVAGYLALLQAALADGARLVTLNRRKYLEAERFDNNPLLYPYAPENRVLRWETDLFMDRVFNFDRVRLDGWLLRIEEVRKGSGAP
jgi:hypothetical protein